jgi:hypothetical protein
MRRLFLSVALIGLAQPAFACINDDESPVHEREFRSQYQDPPDAPPPPAPPSSPTPYPSQSLDQFVTNWENARLTGQSAGGPATPRNWPLIGGGAVLMIGAVTVALSGGRPRS